MKALTLTQPWATLVAIGAKRIETRSWRTDYRGPLAIHAAKGPDKTGFVVTTPCYPILKNAGLEPLELPHGFVVATCELAAVYQMPSGLETFDGWHWDGPDGRLYDYELTYQEKMFGLWETGRYAWLLADVKRLPEPIPARGSLGLWDWEPPQ